MRSHVLPSLRLSSARHPRLTRFEPSKYHRVAERRPTKRHPNLRLAASYPSARANPPDLASRRGSCNRPCAGNERHGCLLARQTMRNRRRERLLPESSVARAPHEAAEASARQPRNWRPSRWGRRRTASGVSGRAPRRRGLVARRIREESSPYARRSRARGSDGPARETSCRGPVPTRPWENAETGPAPNCPCSRRVRPGASTLSQPLGAHIAA